MANINGTSGNDRGIFKLVGTSSFDTINGFAGDDEIEGLASFDRLIGGDGTDTVSGGDGNDTIYGDRDTQLQASLAGNDLLTGGAGADTIYGGAGNDTIFGSFNAESTGDQIGDWLEGDEGNDVFIIANSMIPPPGAGGVDRFRGDDGFDTFRGGSGYDELRFLADSRIFLNTFSLAGNSIERIDTFGFPVSFWGGTGSSVLDFTGIDVSNGLRVLGDGGRTGGGADTITGSDLSDSLIGDGGDDRLIGGRGDDTLLGAYITGNNTLEADDFDTAVFAGARANYFISAVVLDLGVGGIQPALLVDDQRTGPTDTGNDVLHSIEILEFTDQRLWLGTAADQTMLARDNTPWLIQGAGGNDAIMGLAGRDTLDGGSGNDRLAGGAGNDLLIGAEGIDVAVFGGLAADFTAGMTQQGLTVTDLRAGAANTGADVVQDIEAWEFDD